MSVFHLVMLMWAISRPSEVSHLIDNLPFTVLFGVIAGLIFRGLWAITEFFYERSRLKYSAEASDAYRRIMAAAKNP